MTELDVVVNIPIIERIWSVYPVSFISIIGAAFGWTLCYLIAKSDLNYGDKCINRLFEVYTKLIEQKTKM